MARKETSKREETANVSVQVLEELRKLREEVCLARKLGNKKFYLAAEVKNCIVTALRLWKE